MTKAISINGRTYTVVDALSCGPGCEPHTYQIKGGAYVTRIGTAWKLVQRGQFPRPATVEIEGGR